VAQGLLQHARVSSLTAGGGRHSWGAIITKVIVIRIVEGTTVEGFLIVSGALAMLIGLVAMLEGNLHCFGSMRHKKK
jgi:hypothetical protein